MSQDLYFYRQKIINKESCDIFSYEEIAASIKVLLENRDLEEEKLQKSLFDEVKADCIEISAGEEDLEKFWNDERLRLSRNSRFFIVNEEIFSAIEAKVKSQEKKLNKSNILSKRASQLYADFSIIKQLFDEKLLFVNLQ